jgi:catechol 2,3-dioxygenase-like lactoylglutathione lyase family enzyme
MTSAARAVFVAVHPVIPVADVEKAVEYFGKLGFTIAFRDPSAPHMYVGMKRDDVEIHLQWMHEEHFTRGGDRVNLRFMVDDVNSLYAELAVIDVLGESATPRDTPWGTREFAFYDPNGNAMTFYRDL